MSNFFEVLILVSVITVNAFFGFIVFKGNKQRKNLLFSAIIFLAIFWTVSNYLAEIIRNYELVLWLVRSTYIEVVFIAALFFDCNRIRNNFDLPPRSLISS